jgi:hypothetical protein
MQFYTDEPTAKTAWRFAVLMGVNTRTYKFALAEALLMQAKQGRTDIPLGELAAPYAMALLRHLDMPQATEASALGDSDFLTVALAERTESMTAGAPTERLLDAAVDSMPAMVHNLRGGVEVPYRFYELKGRSADRVVVLTPELLTVAGSEDAASLEGELASRWSIVESSFAVGMGRSLLDDGMAVHDLVLTDRHRRRAISGVTPAVIGFQRGRCLICTELLGPGDPIAVDHVFPFSLMASPILLGWPDLDLDAVWNLAPAHTACNELKSNRPPTPDEKQGLAARNAAIMGSPHPLKKTLELVLRRYGFNARPDDWWPFLTGALP